MIWFSVCFRSVLCSLLIHQKNQSFSLDLTQNNYFFYFLEFIIICSAVHPWRCLLLLCHCIVNFSAQLNPLRWRRSHPDFPTGCRKKQQPGDKFPFKPVAIVTGRKSPSFHNLQTGNFSNQGAISFLPGWVLVWVCEKHCKYYCLFPQPLAPRFSMWQWRVKLWTLLLGWGGGVSTHTLGKFETGHLNMLLSDYLWREMTS